MSKFLSIIIFICFTASVFAQEVSEYEKRLQKVKEVENQIETYIEKNLNNPLPRNIKEDFIKDYESEYKKSFNSIQKQEQKEAILPLKKIFLRSLFFKENPDIIEYYSNHNQVDSINTNRPGIPYRSYCFDDDFEDSRIGSGYNIRVGKYIGGECLGTTITNNSYEDPLFAPSNIFEVTNNVPDPIAGSSLMQVNNGYHAVRINSNECAPGGRSVTLIKELNFPFDSGETFHTYSFSYALVSEFPEHENQNPIFQAKALDASGQELDSFCVVANPQDNPFFEKVQEEEDNVCNHDPVISSDWTCASLSFTANPGETVFLEFTATGCGQTAHYGYAYIDDIECHDCEETNRGSLNLPEFSPCQNLNRFGKLFSVEQTPPYIGNLTGTIIDAELRILQGNTEVAVISGYTITPAGNIMFFITNGTFAGLSGGFDFEVSVDYSLDGGIVNVTERHTTPGSDNDFYYDSDDCCDNFDDASFAFGYDTVEDKLEVSQYELYNGQNVTHEWYVLSSPNEDSGPYTPVNSLTGSSSGVLYVLSNPQDDLFYTVIHKVISEDCGEICYARETYIDIGFRGSSISSSSIEDCCMIYEYWPNGPGSPSELDASFSSSIVHSPGNPDKIEASSSTDYSSNPNITQEWIFYSSPNENSGPYTYVDSASGDSYTSPDLESSTWYFLVLKVAIGECEIETCYGYKHNTDTAGLISERSIQNNISCDDIPECIELDPPSNFTINETDRYPYISWNHVDGAVEYNVYITLDVSVQQTIQRITDQYTTTNNYNTPYAHLIPFGGTLMDICIIVEAVCADGSTSRPSEEQCFEINSYPQTAPFQGSVSPNPSNGNFSVFLESSYSSSVSLTLHNYQGLTVNKKQGAINANEKKEFEWKDDYFRTGMYFITIETEKETKVLKLIIE